MLSHTTTRDWLIPYADGMLAADERRRIDSHVAGCAACAAELREVRELNLLLVTLPPAPPAAVAPFWLNLQAVLPQRRVLRIPRFTSYRRLGLALAAATIAVLAAAGSALAAPAALPDNPLFAVKQLEESLRLTFTPANDRLTVQLQLASERLREARAMATNHKPLLAENSLRAFRITINDAAAALKNPADPPAAKAALQALRTELAAVEQANAVRADDDADVKQLVLDASAELDRIEGPDAGTTATPVVVGEQATPQPTPQPVSRPTPQPKPSDGDREQTSGHH
ncbi:MAG: hypothetical protein QOJ33_1557 [Chloroflexota bacterium]|nr:hypothetical protein [Chloroflexota bacterium]